jgi:hypothetical protein
MKNFGDYAKYKKEQERLLIARRVKIISAVLLVLIIAILCGYIIAMSNLHYWYIDENGYGFLFSVGSRVFRLGQTP